MCAQDVHLTSNTHHDLEIIAQFQNVLGVIRRAPTPVGALLPQPLECGTTDTGGAQASPPASILRRLERRGAHRARTPERPAAPLLARRRGAEAHHGEVLRLLLCDLSFPIYRNNTLIFS